MADWQQVLKICGPINQALANAGVMDLELSIITCLALNARTSEPPAQDARWRCAACAERRRVVAGSEMRRCWLCAFVSAFTSPPPATGASWSAPPWLGSQGNRGAHPFLLCPLPWQPRGVVSPARLAPARAGVPAGGRPPGAAGGRGEPDRVRWVLRRGGMDRYACGCSCSAMPVIAQAHGHT
jgi:hypothetical protein